MSSHGDLTLFVPGRVCLCGEHSDWAGGFRSANPDIVPGQALVATTKEGISGKCSKRADGVLQLSSSLAGSLSVPAEDLLGSARDPSNRWRYAAGTAYVILDRYGVRGMTLDMDSDLPARKGLSSSAAVCVLVARAFNELYGLRMTIAGVMDVAYAGERLTGSLCGRMDQCVAFGRGAVAQMSFDGEVISHRIVQTPSSPLYVVFADLGGSKDTSLILRDLQKAYPQPASNDQRRLHEALGPRNEETTRQVADALSEGNAEKLGALYTQAQQIFDECAAPMCPSELTSPKLHEALVHPRIRPLVFGGKGVGSQGDGSVQFVARGQAEAQELLVLLSSLGMPDAHILTIGGTPAENGTHASEGTTVEPLAKNPNASLAVQRRVRTAVVTAAGFGTRLYPASRSICPKPLMPIIDKDGFVKPLLLHIVEQCVDAGISKVVVVSGPGEQAERVREVFSEVKGGLAKALKPHMREYASRIAALERVVDVVVQETPEGFGHAVAQAASLLEADEPFALLLGDVVFKVPEGTPSCLRQMLDIFERDPSGRSVVGVSEVDAADAGAYGVVQSEIDAKVAALKVLDFVEKPDSERAQELAENGLCKIVLGPYVFTRSVMEALIEDVKEDRRLKGEVQLTPAVARVMKTEGLLAAVLEGEALDTGNPTEYAETMTKLAQHVL